MNAYSFTFVQNDYFYMEPAFEYPGHQLPGGRVKLSPHHKWLASYGTDGKLMLRTIGQMVSYNSQWNRHRGYLVKVII